MFADTSRSEVGDGVQSTESVEHLPVLQRAVGCLRMRVGAETGRSRIKEAYQSGAGKIRLPKSYTHDGVEIVMMNTAGGLTGGDQFDSAVTIEADATCVATTASSEKIYAARDTAPAEISQRMILAENASLDWLPQSTILFDQARMKRRIDIHLATSTSLFLAETLVFGRAAMGEKVLAALVSDSWRLHRAGGLVLAEELRLSGDIQGALARSGVCHGKSAYASGIIQATEPADLCETLRARAGAFDGELELGIGVLHGLVVWRTIAAEGQSIERWISTAYDCVRGRTLPRSWLC